MYHRGSPIAPFSCNLKLRTCTKSIKKTPDLVEIGPQYRAINEETNIATENENIIKVKDKILGTFALSRKIAY